MRSRPLRNARCFIALAVLAVGCDPVVGDGVSTTEIRDVPRAFTSIQVRSGLIVEVTVDPTRSPAFIEVESDRNLLPHILTEIADDQLQVAAGNIAPSAPTAVRITVPTLASVAGSDRNTAVIVERVANDALSVHVGHGERSSISKARATTSRRSWPAKRSWKRSTSLRASRAYKRSMARTPEIHVTEALDVAASNQSMIRVRGAAEITERLSSGAMLTRDP